MTVVIYYVINDSTQAMIVNGLNKILAQLFIYIGVVILYVIICAMKHVNPLTINTQNGMLISSSSFLSCEYFLYGFPTIRKSHSLFK